MPCFNSGGLTILFAAPAFLYLPAHLLSRPYLALPNKRLIRQCLQLLLNDRLCLGSHDLGRWLNGRCVGGRLCTQSLIGRYGSRRRWGGGLFSVGLRDDSCGEFALRLLKQRRFGKASFYPLGLMRLIKHSTFCDGILEQRQNVLGTSRGGGCDRCITVEWQCFCVAFCFVGS